MYNIPTITKNLLIVNVVMFLLTQFIPGIEDLFGLHYLQASHFSLYQFFTYMFMHGSWTHLFFNMFALWMFGMVMERTWGGRRFLIYYIICGIGAGLCQELTQFVQVVNMVSGVENPLDYVLHLAENEPTAPASLNGWTTVGASGSIYGILLAFGMTYPENRMFVFPLPFPIKAKWFVVGYAAIEVFLALTARGDGIAHVAHLGGMLFGFFLIRYWRHVAESQKSHFTGWGNYQGSRSQGPTILSKIRNAFKISRGDVEEYMKEEKGGFTSTSTHQKDWDYNAQRKAEDEEIDRILEKIRRCGYAGLTSEEKRKLFEASKK